MNINVKWTFKAAIFGQDYAKDKQVSSKWISW